MIPATIKVQDEISVRRSLRHGSTTMASNCGIPREIIEANQRWGEAPAGERSAPSNVHHVGAVL